MVATSWILLLPFLQQAYLNWERLIIRVRYFEELPDNTEDDLNLPDAVFIITDTLLIFDDIFKKIKIVSNAFIENDNLEDAYQKAIDQIDAIEKKLLEPLKSSPFPKPSGKKMDPDKIESNFEKEEFKNSVQKMSRIYSRVFAQ